MDLHASKRLLGDGDCFAFGRRASHLIPFLLGFGLVLLLGGFFPEALFELFLDIVDEIVEHLVLHLFLQVLLLFPVFQLGLPVLVTIGEVVGGRGEAADAAIAAIGDSGARLVFLALGAPKQERFAAYAQDKLPATGFISIGAGLDFISGLQTRAPAFVRAIAAEWLWRMLGNPKRLAARYGACLLILPGLVLKALRQKRTV